MEASAVILWLANVRDAYESQNLELPNTGKDDIPHIMPTPPASRSPKRKRLGDDDNDDNNDELTPKSGANTSGRGQQVPIAIRPFSQPYQQLQLSSQQLQSVSQQSIAPLPLRPFDPQCKLQPSTSRSSSKLGSEASSRSKARRTSPVKRSMTLRLLAKPVEFVEPSEDLFAQIPASAHNLLSEIRRVTGFNKSAFIPAMARDIIKRELHDGKEWPDQWFFQSDDAQGTPELAVAEMQFKALYEILVTAKRSMKQVRNELAWNCLVHCPLLKLATRSFSRGGVVCEPVMSAGIASHWLPEMASRPMAAANKDAVASGKMVDFVLALDLENPRPRDQALANAVLEVMKHQTDESLSINHTLYNPLGLNPIGVGIETKANAVPTEGTLQLGIWTAAWHRRMRDLGYTDQLITLPLILCHDHDWSLYFACDRGHKIEIVGPLLLGSTDRMVSLYPLLAALVELCKWVEGTFRDWWITQLGG
ncbi:hypothetical protein RB595_002378 [Gaeumannomyces hyphopodioides]